MVIFWRFAPDLDFGTHPQLFLRVIVVELSSPKLCAYTSRPGPILIACVPIIQYNYSWEKRALKTKIKSDPAMVACVYILIVDRITINYIQATITMTMKIVYFDSKRLQYKNVHIEQL